MTKSLTSKNFLWSVIILIVIGAVVASVVSWNTSSEEEQFGWITAVSQRDDSFLVTFHLATFSFDNTQPTGYKITDLKKEREFQVAHNATITVQGDVLVGLMDNGIINRDSVSTSQHIQTVSLEALIEKAQAKNYDLNKNLRASFHFYLYDGEIVKVVQQYVP